MSATLRTWRFAAAVCAGALLLGASEAVASSQSGVPATPVAPSAGGQSERVVKPDTPDATRQELTQLRDEAQRQANDASASSAARTRAESDGAAIQRRLDAGDFQPGDRFTLTVVADSVRRTEVVVRTGPAIDFGPLPELSLAGVLRSELQPAILKHVGRYYVNPEVRVEFLTRVTISGPVVRPGSHSVPSFTLVSDVVTQAAGGPTSLANTDKIVVLRDGREVIDRKGYQRAVQDGLTIQRAGIQPGDEIRVAERSRRNWQQIVMVGMFSVSIFTALLALIRSSYAE